MQTLVLWFRNDLRIHDNAVLFQAIEEVSEESSPFTHLLCVYCYDEEYWLNSRVNPGHFPITSTRRLNFLKEAIMDLKDKRLKERIGSDLLIMKGKPHVELSRFDFLKDFNVTKIVASREITEYGIKSENLLFQKLSDLRNAEHYDASHSHSCELKLIWNRNLLEFEDLPFTDNIQYAGRRLKQYMKMVPDDFSEFKSQVLGQEKQLQVRSLYKLPESRTTLKEFTITDQNKLARYSYTLTADPEEATQQSLVSSLKGGETHALARLVEYFWDKNLLRFFKETRNGLMNMNDSTKLSPYLAIGCISPRLIYHEVKRYESLVEENMGTHRLIHQLLWRDYYYLLGMKYGKKIFRPSGLRDRSFYHKPSEEVTQPSENAAMDSLASEERQNLFDSWKNGMTGYPFVDACMRELKQTGWCSNRGRLVVASFLTKDLNMDWRLGASWFESNLLDYDPTSNWLNWAFVSGFGSDHRVPKEKYFDVVQQSRDFDPEGEYIKKWCPELRKVPTDFVHEPYRLTQKQMVAFKCQDYPSQPICSIRDNEEDDRSERRRKGMKRRCRKRKEHTHMKMLLNKASGANRKGKHH